MVVKAKTLGHVTVQAKTHGVFDNYAQRAWGSRESPGRFAQKCAAGPDQVGQSCPDRPVLQCQTPHAFWFGMKKDLGIFALSAFPLCVLIRKLAVVLPHTLEPKIVKTNRFEHPRQAGFQVSSFLGIPRAVSIQPQGSMSPGHCPFQAKTHWSESRIAKTPRKETIQSSSRCGG